MYGSVSMAKSCPEPFGELLTGTPAAETAHALVEVDDGLIVLGARTVAEKKSQGVAWKIDRCGRVIWTLTMAPGGGSNFLAGIPLADKGILIGGSAHRWDDSEKNDAILIKLDRNGRRAWTKPFQGEQNLSVTNLLQRQNTILAVLQPHARAGADEKPEKLKPDEERPHFIEIDINGEVIDQFTPLAEEKAKLFHLAEIPGTGKLLASGRFSYFGQPTRPGIWEIDRAGDAVKRLYSGDTIGLSFGSHSDTPSSQTTLLWRSALAQNATGDPISLTHLDDGLPKEVWTVPRSASATLPATSLKTRNGDFLIVLQSFPKKGQEMTLTASRVSASGQEVWTKRLTRPHDSAVTDMVELADGTFMLTGRSYDPPKEDGQAWLIALSPDGVIDGKSINTHR